MKQHGISTESLLLAIVAMLIVNEIYLELLESDFLSCS